MGAHPGYPDRANFGREEMGLSGAELAASVFEQIATLDAGGDADAVPDIACKAARGAVQRCR